MKKISLLFLFILSTMTFAQNGFNYKALITDNGNAMANHSVNIQFTILENGSTSVYQETHTATTDANGIVAVNIGEGSVVSGNFTTIDWGSNAYFLKVEIDTGNGYQDFGTTEFKAVPYAKFADRVAISDNIQGIPVSSTTPANGQVLKYNGTQFVPADDDTSGGSGTDGVVNSVNFSGTTTKTLTLSRSNGLSNLTATFTDAVNDADHSTTNELQTISKTGNTVTLSNGGGSFTDAVNDADHSTTNELQTISKTGNTITLSNGGGSVTDSDTHLTEAQVDAYVSNNGYLTQVDNIQGIPVSSTTPSNGQVLKYNGTQFVPADDDTSGGSGTDGVVNSANFSGTTTKTLTLSRSNGLGNVTATFTDAVNDADHSTTNELQTISKTGNTVTLSNGGGSFTDAVNDADHSTTNELQTISKTGNTVTLSNGGGSFTDAVNDADHSTTNELQNLTLSGTQLSISNGNNVNFTGWDTDASDDFSGDYDDLSNKPHVWNISATTNTATANTQNIVHSGNLGIGTGTIPSTNHSKVYISNGSSGSAYGVESHIGGGGSGAHNKYGYLASINTSDNGFQAGLHTYVNNSGNAVSTGVDNFVHSGGSNEKFGVRNYLNGGGSGAKYGVSNQIEGAGTGTQVGTNNNLEGTGTGMQVGTMNRIDNDNDNMQGGTINLIHGDGDGVHIGSYSGMYGTGNGLIIAVSDTITNTGSGSHIGNFSYLSGGDGVHYGAVNHLVDGAGIHVGSENVLGGAGDGMQIGGWNVINNSGSGQKIGYWSKIDSDTGVQAGYYTDMSNDTSGRKTGVYAELGGSGTGDQLGFYGELTGTGNGTIYAVADTISNSGNGIHYGVYSYLNGSGTGYHFGSYNKLEGSGTGHHYGNYNMLSGSAYQVGNYNFISNSGSHNSLGTRNQLSGNGNGIAYGTYNYINNSGSGVHYGVYNYMTNGTGTKYGTYNKITATGAGTQIAVYGEVQDGTGNYAGQFEGDVKISKKLVAPDSGDADMKAYAYGEYFNGNPRHLSDNISGISRITSGYYKVNLSPTMNSTNDYIVVANLYNTRGFITIIKSTDYFYVKTYNPAENLTDFSFTFVVYKK